MPRSIQVETSGIQAVFEEVLSRPEYQYVNVSPLGRWLGTALDFLGRLLGRWLSLPGEGTGRIALVAMILAAALLLARWVRGRSPKGGRLRAEAAAARDPRDAIGWRRWAAAAALEGRHRAAATALYEAVVLHLETQGALDRRDWKTPGDYLQELKGDDSLRGGMRDFLGCFLEVAFGQREPTADAVETLDRFATRLGCPR